MLAMALAAFAAVGIPAVPGLVAITCHQGSFYWAGEEAAARGQTPAKTAVQRMNAMVGVPNGVQAVMLALRRAGTWDFARVNNALPPAGTVLLWTEGPTHSAIVTAGGISGYNQGYVFPHLPALGNHSTCAPAQLAANRRICFTIAEDDIVARAAALGL
ncbi:MAG: hypothetical protein ACREE5_06605 [Acetobacteraceae bacterium]